jgi:ABC-type lipoprotein export system ATPase subunit/predicted metal-dependent phosphoesterase TrpH
MTVATQPRYDARGSLWYRWDLHFHTPASYDYDDKSVTNQQIVARLIRDGVHIVAVTDHHTIDVPRIKELQQRGSEQLTVLPGIELRDDHGGDPIHYICIFPEDCDLDHVWTTLQGSLGLTPVAIRDKGGDDKVYIPIEKGAELARSLGGVVSIHAGAKSNSIEGIRNTEQFQQRIKYDITKNWVDLMEIGQLKDIDAHLNIIFPAIGFETPLIICSDNHNVNEYSVKVPLWFRADPTFRGLLMVKREPCDRVYIGDRPSDIARVEQNPTKYIKRITFQRKDETPATEKWFSGSINFNPGLVAIIGNKGSGKSALADTIGLLGSTKNGAFFSFLSRERFRHPSAGQAKHFEATIEWISGEKVTRGLDEVILPEEVERLKYLPQDHVERVCNELAGVGEEGFEQELKAVIFSHVPETKRIGHSSLDELVRFQTGEKQKRIDSLLKQLREASRERALLETQADPSNRLDLSEKIKRRELELAAHDKAKPLEVPNPKVTTDTAAPDKVIINELFNLEERKRALNTEISIASDSLRSMERRHAVAKLLVEKLTNFEKDFVVFEESLIEDTTELGISAKDLVSLTISTSVPEKIRDEASITILSLNKQLDYIDPPGLRKQVLLAEESISELQLQLDAPNRAYQNYLTDLAIWQESRAKIEGTEAEPESLAGLRSALAAVDGLPVKIAMLKTKLSELALQIHTEKIAQAEIYRDLYAPVQHFIDTHVIAKDKLQLDFRAELVSDDFVSRLLGILALNRRGSFMGIDEGRSKAEKFVQSTNWGDTESVKKFLDGVDTALHMDQRERTVIPTQVKDQLIKGRKPEEVFELLYGLEYVGPRYILQWEGKDIAMLSPGERGTLLLVFYLLIDLGDMPLVIDQPEGNLDNHTIAKVLVDCIRAAHKKRQVFIVTHNPNLAVVCDADQVVHAGMEKDKGNMITYIAGALENPAMTKYVTDVLEGTRWAFDKRGAKYDVGEA